MRHMIPTPIVMLMMLMMMMIKMRMVMVAVVLMEKLVGMRAVCVEIQNEGGEGG